MLIEIEGVQGDSYHVWPQPMDTAGTDSAVALVVDPNRPTRFTVEIANPADEYIATTDATSGTAAVTDPYFDHIDLREAKIHEKMIRKGTGYRWTQGDGLEQDVTIGDVP